MAKTKPPTIDDPVMVEALSAERATTTDAKRVAMIDEQIKFYGGAPTRSKPETRPAASMPETR